MRIRCIIRIVKLLVLSYRQTMSPLLSFLVFLVISSLVIGNSLDRDNRLKVLSVYVLAMLLLSSSMISTEWARMTSELVDDETDPHHGLPDVWEGKQVVCFNFPGENAPREYDGGRHHIDSDGTKFLVDSNWNGSGACVGGFSGFEIGIELLDEAVIASGGDFAYNYTQFSFGIQIDSIGGIEPCDVAPCSEDFSYGAWWAINHNGQLAPVGISDLPLEDDSVITLTIVTW